MDIFCFNCGQKFHIRVDVREIIREGSDLVVHFKPYYFEHICKEQIIDV